MIVSCGSPPDHLAPRQTAGRVSDTPYCPAHQIRAGTAEV